MSIDDEKLRGPRKSDYSFYTKQAAHRNQIRFHNTGAGKDSGNQNNFEMNNLILRLPARGTLPQIQRGEPLRRRRCSTCRVHEGRRNLGSRVSGAGQKEITDDGSLCFERIVDQIAVLYANYHLKHPTYHLVGTIGHSLRYIGEVYALQLYSTALRPRV